MTEFVYLIRLGKTGRPLAQQMLGQAPEGDYLRIATLAPLTSLNFPRSFEAELVAVTAIGLVIGAARDPAIPRALIPWMNLAFVCEERERRAAGVEPSATAATFLARHLKPA